MTARDAALCPTEDSDARTGLINALLGALSYLGLLWTAGLAGPSSPAERVFIGLAILSSLWALVLSTMSLAQARSMVARGTVSIVGFLATAHALAGTALPIAYACGAWLIANKRLPAFVIGLVASSLLQGWPDVVGPGVASLTPLLQPLGLRGPMPCVLLTFALCVTCHSERAVTRMVLVSIALVVPCATFIDPLAEFAFQLTSPLAVHGHDIPLYFSDSVFSVTTSLALFGGLIADTRRCNPDYDRAPVVLPCLACIAGLSACLPSVAWHASGQQPRRLAVLNVGGFDWDVPDFESSSPGMFGLLPVYLNRSGWVIETTTLRELEAGGGGDFQVLAIINCPVEWSSPQRACLLRFVARGGALLVLGDHTDVFGLMRGHNSLLREFGIEYQFDSALPFPAEWTGAAFWNPWTLGVDVRPEHFGISVGASLKVRPPARVVLHGRYAFADVGNPNNIRGAFLGNYRYQEGESIRDIALVAARQYGQGTVLVYGDTSTFQNTALHKSFDLHIRPVLERLCHPASANIGWRCQWLSLAFLIGVAAAATARRNPFLFWQGTSWMALGTLLGFAAVELYPQATVRSRDVKAKTLVLDRSSFPDIGHYEAGWNWVSPIALGAQRVGLLYEEWSTPPTRQALDGVAVYVIIGPRKHFAIETAEMLLDFVEDGGGLILATSFDRVSGCEPLLGAIEVAIQPVVVGPIPPVESTRADQPRFVLPSPVLTMAEHVDLFRYGGEAIVSLVPHGLGRIVVIGDYRFFSDRNIEGAQGSWPGNLRFLVDVLLEIVGSEGRLLTSGLPDPEYPEAYLKGQ